MTGNLATGIGSIIMAFITMITSLFGIISNRPDNMLIQGFEPKDE